MQRTLEDLQGILRNHREEMAREYGVTAIGIFGSHVRGEAAPDSDIDILVEFQEPMGFFRFLEREEKLADWLGAPVDLVTKAALKPRTLLPRAYGRVALPRDRLRGKPQIIAAERSRGSATLPYA